VLGKPVAWFFEEDSEAAAAEVAPQSLPEAQTQEEPSVRPTPDVEDRLDQMERILGALVEQQARAAPEERLAQAVAQAMKQALEPLHDVMASLAHGHMGTQAELARMQGKLREMEADLREMDEEDEDGDCPGQEACAG
jgi:chromosome segregation ATPase